MKLYYDSPIGKLVIAEIDNKITHLVFNEDFSDVDGIPEGMNDLLSKAKGQLDEYFAGSRKSFDLPLEPKGTEFQKRVWKALQDIPYGVTKTYGQIAAEIGNPKGPRAVGLANNRNPISIIIPCHRVIGANGSLVGYGGGLHIKEFLLKLESEN